MTGRVTAVCVSGVDLLPLPGKRPSRSGIDKRPVTGRVDVHALGLDGDRKDLPAPHRSQARGGALQEGRVGIAELGRELPAGRFGENLRTKGVDLVGALLGEQWRIGTALFEVTAWRIPCANFARFWDVPDLVKRFAAHGATGAYLRVLETGDVGAGDEVDVVFRPEHGVTVGEGFRIVMNHNARLPELAPALEFLPVKDRPKIAARIEKRLAART